jgi:hypothetical protein
LVAAIGVIITHCRRPPKWLRRTQSSKCGSARLRFQ